MKISSTTRKIIKAGFLSLILQLPLVAQDERFRTPVEGGRIMCVFNTTKCFVAGKYHTAVDYGATLSPDVLATNRGKIVVVQKNGAGDHGLGNVVIIEHEIINLQGAREKIYSLYGHLESVSDGIGVGGSVVKSQKLGKMGGTGKGKADMWGVHLHFEIKRRPILHNPNGVGQFWGYTPKSAVDYGYLDPIWLINSGISVSSNTSADVRKTDSPNSRIDLAGEWIEAGSGIGSTQNKVRISSNDTQLTAVRITGTKFVPAGEVTWQGAYTSNPFNGKLRIAQADFANARWVDVSIRIIGKDVLVLSVVRAGSESYKMTSRTIRYRRAK